MRDRVEIASMRIRTARVIPIRCNDPIFWIVASSRNGVLLEGIDDFGRRQTGEVRHRLYVPDTDGVNVVVDETRKHRPASQIDTFGRRR